MRMGAYTTNPTSTEDGEFVFGYDYMSRRVGKQMPSWDAALNDGEGDWHPTLVLDQRHVYDGWNVVLVLDGLDDNAVVRKYSWGLDLSGWSGDASPSGIHGAGGIGGLLAAVETSGPHAGSYWYLYDANGSVGQVLNATDPQSITPAAHYEYDPYGNSVAKSGTYADDNPFRFSTKWRDTETGLYYYGYRYYSPGLGRWISRDPIGEEGGLNLLSFLENQALHVVDALGERGITAGGTVGAAVARAVAAFLAAVAALETMPCDAIDEGIRMVYRTYQDMRNIVETATGTVSISLPDKIKKRDDAIRKAKERCEPQCPPKNPKWSCSIKARNWRKGTPCYKKIFSAGGKTKQEAERAARLACYGAGCHKPGPNGGDCGHVTCHQLP